MTDFFSRRDLAFQLYELHQLPEVLKFEPYRQHDRATCDAILEAAATLAEEQFQPAAALADAQEPHFDGTRVHQPREVQQVLDAYIAGGFMGASFATEDGGLQLPALVTSAIGAWFSAANIGTIGYPFLAIGAAHLIGAHGSAEQKRRYMRPIVEGRFFGTMCLSEPQAGSSLGDIKTRATPRSDGRYKLSGNKMWISGGEHDLSENIVHMVLAKIEGAPAGVKGISLFIVPKKTVNADGTVGARNGVKLIGLNHKMGYRGTTNTALAFGDGEECIGELVGEPNKGLACMFHMMNEARIGVGMGAVALGYAGYRHSLEYAKTRPQGRALSNKDPASPPVAIIEHADVKRMLLLQKSYVEGGLALGFYCARLVDEQHAHPDEAVRKEASRLLDLITPIVKAWPSEWCLEANKMAIQVLGGYGYTRDYPVERLYRDNRLNLIHEGTNGIQSLDLLGRKVLGDGGKTMQLLFGRIRTTADAAPDALKNYAQDLREALTRIEQVTQKLGGAAAKGQVELAMANSAAYLEMFGHTVIAWLWLEQAQVASAALGKAQGEDRDFYEGKLAACRYFFVHELPKTKGWAELLHRLDDTLLKTAANHF